MHKIYLTRTKIFVHDLYYEILMPQKISLQIFLTRKFTKLQYFMYAMTVITSLINAVCMEWVLKAKIVYTYIHI